MKDGAVTYIVTNFPELAIWITPTPFKSKSGEWFFFNFREDYEQAYEKFKKQYGSKFILSLASIEKNHNPE